MRPDRLRELLNELRQANARPSLICDVEACLAAAERYEAACQSAIELSGIEEAGETAEAWADALCDVAWEVQKHPPRTISGVLIHAHALASYLDAEKDSSMNAPGLDATILRRGLADAVLRVAGVTT